MVSKKYFRMLQILKNMANYGDKNFKNICKGPYIDGVNKTILENGFNYITEIKFLHISEKLYQNSA